MMSQKRTSLVAWALCGIICVIALITLAISTIHRNPDQSLLTFAGKKMFTLIPIVFSITAALILSRQPRNTIGWLLMIPALASTLPTASYLQSFPAAPTTPGILLLLALWFDSWVWLLLILPILCIPLLFPTGQPLSPRWRWPIFMGLGMFILFIFYATFSPTFGNGDVTWVVPNPIGFLPETAWLFVAWAAAMIALTTLCVASLFIRYRGATAVERLQIKWLLYACGLFVIVYVPGFWISQNPDTITDKIWNILFNLSILAIPAAIAIAILRYHLWDIDVIIRRTLVYGALTATLALIFIGGVTLLQALVTAISGQQSPISIVISTLVIAAMFTPLRQRIQNDIDRRFYRRKYDAQKTLEAFANSIRNEVEMKDLTENLLSVVEDTMQINSLGLWLKDSEK